MIDTHSHILPELDDGAQHLSESLAFAETAVKQGVEVMFATPHCCNGVYSNSKQEILDACSDLSRMLQEKSIPLKIVPGAEIRVNHDLVKAYDNGRLLTMNNVGTHLLIELPDMFMKNGISMMIRHLRERGVTPIIAHAERNPVICQRPETAAEFVYDGAAVQITAGSLTGEFGKFAMKAAAALVTMDLVFCLGSDIHPGRKYCMAKAAKRLVRLAGRTKAGLIIHENLSAILEQKHSGTGILEKNAHLCLNRKAQ